MNKKIKSALTEYFEPPNPEGKDDFISSLDVYEINNRITHRYFIISQITYIHKWVWAVSVILFITVLFFSKYFDTGLVRIASSFMPVFALAFVTESGRSENCGMAELEISARFSLRYVIIARLLILGMSNLIISFLFIFLIHKNNNINMCMSVLCIFCPYLLTSFSGLLLTRKIRGKESAYICTGMAALVSVCNIAAYQLLPHIFETAYLTRWIILIVLLLAGCTNELYKKMQMTEELSWSLY